MPPDTIRDEQLCAAENTVIPIDFTDLSIHNLNLKYMLNYFTA